MEVQTDLTQDSGLADQSSILAEDLELSGTELPSSNSAIESDLPDESLAQTATIDEESVSRVRASVAEESLIQVTQHYVQGIIQGQHAYLITNVLNGQSQTLLQPQMVWTIGRNRNSAFPIRDRGLSRRHAVIQYIRHKGFSLIDLNSMNGTFVNGKRLKQRYLLVDGDTVQLGHTAFHFYLSQGYQKLEPIHPEVLSHLNNPEPKSPVDFLALEEPEITFHCHLDP